MVTLFINLTLQNYFRLYNKLAGMTGTALTSREEFEKVYGLEVFIVPTNKTPQRIDLPDYIFQTEKGKFMAVARKVKELHDKGQPVLIGTVSIEKNELLSAYLRKEGITHEILNAKNHEQEGQIVASAGKKGAVVIATNMAGRGVDIKLGGPMASVEQTEEVKNLGGLFVLGTERHEARRIDNQLRGRSGRQGDPGATQFFVSLEDSLMRVFAPDRIKNMMGRLGLPEDEPIQNKIVSRAIESAQTKIEGLNFDTRKHLLEYDDLVNHQRVIMYGRREEVLLGGQAGVKNFIDRALTGVELEEEEINNLKQVLEAKEKAGGSDFINALREVILQVIDMYWMEHLEIIDYMKSSVRLRAYGQRDPLVEFKREGLRLFKELEFSIFNEVLKLLPNIELAVKTEEKTNLQEIHQSAGVLTKSSEGEKGVGQITKNNEFSVNKDGHKVGRNDPCPCGAVKADGMPIKYKHCHGK